MADSVNVTDSLVEIRLIQDDQVAVALGSGVIVATNRVATVRHVIEDKSNGFFDAQQIEIVLRPDGALPMIHSVVKMVGGDDTRDDLLVLEVEEAFDDSLVALLSNAHGAFGRQAAFCGFPKGMPVADSYIGRGYVAPGSVAIKGARNHWVQIETGEARRGMSGGPVVHLDSGRVVGLITERSVPDPGDDLKPTCWALNAGRLLNFPFDIPFMPVEGSENDLTDLPLDLTIEHLLQNPAEHVHQFGLPRDFVGRTDILKVLEEFWTKEGPNEKSIMMLYGLPWVGKSSVIAQFSEGLRNSGPTKQPDLVLAHSFDNGWAVEVFFDNLRKLAPAHLAGRTPIEITDALKPLLKSHRILVVLDAIEKHQSSDLGNLSQIDDADLRYFIQAFEEADRSRLILLSRVKPETKVIALPRADIRLLGGLSQGEANDLYRSHLSSEPPAKWEELCKSLDHHPGGLATVLTQIALNDGLDLDWALRVAQRPVGDDPLVRFENLLADLSDGLDADERTVLLTLSQFSGDVPQEQLAEVLEQPEYEIDDGLFAGISRNQLPHLFERLESRMLLDRFNGDLHAHAFVKRFFARRFAEMFIDKQQNIHRRIAATFRGRFNPPSNPTELEDLLPGLEAVIHSCKAGDLGHALRFLDTKVQGPNREYRLSNKLGAISAFWRVLTHFFEEENVSKPVQFADGVEKDSLLHSVGYCQSVLGAQPWEALPILRESARGLAKRGTASEASEVFRSAAYSAVSAGELKIALEMLAEAAQLTNVGDEEQCKLLVQSAVTRHMTLGENWRDKFQEVSNVLLEKDMRTLSELLPRNSLFVLMLARIGHLERFGGLMENLRNKAQERGWRDIALRHSSIIAITSQDAFERKANAKNVLEKLSSLGRVDLVAELVTRHARYLISDSLHDEAKVFLEKNGAALPLEQYPLLKIDFDITRCACDGRAALWEQLAAECRRLGYAWGIQDIEKYKVNRDAHLV